MVNSAKKGNLANAGLVLEGNKMIASAESWVISSHNPTAHSERMLVERVCFDKHTNFTPGLDMVSIIEPCIMCISACSQAGYKTINYIIPAKKYLSKIPWMSDTAVIDKLLLARQLSNPLELIHLVKYEQEFSRVYEKAMSHLLK
ncbi:hypothetical protein HY408_00140 [Candidatus Gottesmanbacteria bacterium]|nr:hypothetical protein [Candidatus Gottesmanbacteria bacterium]